MGSIIKSGFFKLTKDQTFKVTLIVGVALAIIMNLIYMSMGGGDIKALCNGHNMFCNSLSPTQNFGLAVPINLIIFTIGEFTCGTIRNKIIAGHKRTSIYLSLLIIGFIFTVSLMAVYFIISVGFASIIGGFKLNGEVTGGTFRPEYIYQYLLMALCVYIFITSLAIFVSVLTRTIGISLPIVIVVIMVAFFMSFIPMVNNIASKEPNFETIQIWFNPLYTFGVFSLSKPVISNKWFIASMVSPLAYATLLTALGMFVFNKIDLK